MSANPESGRRWGGFVCPDCRFVFRVPKEHDGRGLVCPSCRRLLRIPAVGEPTPPLVEEKHREFPAHETDGEGTDGEGGSLRRRRVRKRRDGSGKSGTGPSWDRDTKSSRRSAGRRGGKAMRWMLPAGGVAFVALVVGVILALRGGRPDDTIVSGNSGTVARPEPGISGGGRKQPADPAAKSDSEVLAEAEPLAKAFLGTRSVPELARLVRNPEIAEARMRQWYSGETLEPQGLAEFNPTGVVNHGDVAVRIDVRLADRSTKGMDFVRTAGGLRIDWESWVGWCEMPWKVFITERPTRPKIFRVVVKPVDYYNFGFTDDRKWRSLRLESLDGEIALYGYVARDTLLDKKIQVDPDTKQSPMVLKVRFPENAPDGGKQVLIEEWVADGWVEPNIPGS